jgi:monoamine oxidase
MPAVTSAEVQTEPSRTKIGSDSTRAVGKRRASSAHVPDRYSGTGVLTGFVYAARARKLAPLAAEARKQHLLAEVAKRFGRPALEPIGYYEANGSQEQWTRGCVTGFLTSGATVLFRSAVRDPVGPLHWAGSETATVWPSFIDGAIRSGERAAAVVGKG